jgi:hypothetical protein
MLKRILKISGIVFLFIFLTVLTQVGGLIYLLFLFLWRITNQKFPKLKLKRKALRTFLKASSFLVFYTIISMTLVPLIAKPFGRVPLPVWSDSHIKPLNIMTCFLNRHYVKPELYDALMDVSKAMESKHPGTVIAYLDANLPFVTGFPLLPHLSHDDGEKLDLAFLYQNAKTKTELNDAAPSFIGYGVFEEPQQNEINQPKICKNKGYWQYSILGSIVPQWNKADYQFDIDRTKYLVKLLSKHASICKIFIEPHLKNRLGANSSKVRFHGCGAVRHDDHIHIQL